MLAIHPSLQNVGVAERAILRHLVEHMEDRLFVGVILDSSDLLWPEHRSIFRTIMDMPMYVAGNHVAAVQESLELQSDIEALRCFEMLSEAPRLDSWVLSLQLAAHLLLQNAYRRDAEFVFSMLVGGYKEGEEDPW